MTQRKSTKGTKQIGAEVAAELIDEFKAFCVARGDTLRYHLEMAMRRHLDNPPPMPTAPPLPPVPVPVAGVGNTPAGETATAPVDRASVEAIQVITNLDRGLGAAALGRVADWIRSGDTSAPVGESDRWVLLGINGLLAVPKTRREKVRQAVLEWVEKPKKGKK